MTRNKLDVFRIKVCMSLAVSSLAQRCAIAMLQSVIEKHITQNKRRKMRSGNALTRRRSRRMATCCVNRSGGEALAGLQRSHIQ
jgi:hypothetical protein